MNANLLMDAVIFGAEISEGRNPAFVATKGIVNGMSMRHVNPTTNRQFSNWHPDEDQFLKENLGWLSEEEIAEHLGRTVVSVHLRWERDLHLCAPSKNPDNITANQGAKILGVDAHKIAHWCDVGLIPARMLPSARYIRLINRVTFDRWVVSPSNWIYFDWRKIPDRRLYRLCKLRAKRWGDQWWSTVRAAQFHGVTAKDVLRQITILRRLPGVQVSASLGGRHKNPSWKNWFVLKSDAVKLTFVRGKGMGGKKFTPRAEAWMVKAYKQGVSVDGIARSMGSKCCSETIRKNIIRLTKKG